MSLNGSEIVKFSLDMKAHAFGLIALGILGCVAPTTRANAADEAAPTITSSTNAASGADAQTNSSSVNGGEIARIAQFELLSQLASEHRTRAEEATKANQIERASWEDQLASELLAKASNILGHAYETVAAEPSNGSVQGSAAGEGGVNSLSLAERAYLDKLQERLQTIQQEIAALAAQATSYAQQLPTNTIPYAYGNASAQLQENGREQRSFLREQADLELKKLEFWALRRRGN